ncbi:molecular chaperone DnaK [Candidatus Giovannonibacteria bacterium RIFCSPLOWO2_02_FULL_45_14]|uniref:Chaperone protein DnaK n=1 Tax=Candidatus Giovannonibacteria bacterium RIFCSPLOWO2_12_FULL_44_15 TaxID=1798364 RepID=A0A1F5Y138_9BACT|nr:MAG: molecular chaperone DnaK [Candidatus Giovannonibacteria bacterium RIFCSPHIGHO2_02_FULL_44_31]OGF75922.1 MAG: molecular chaperone DnaK [Candidatus Giovannonibacteria bacterium RIFCSPHIGHO2_12_FULL_44_29]OGF90784.1 MAG: molecular chaperone DnaK [Candidatus Giovannonibacteria bacterium RIFCSPLOWO2_02_FULL_45_14]OGF93839.1 MAG: molecular chaperone DnaK [Candidatus Giovannonibacteria bacterium RIFCSPLOWO2_12_FULL_44_15]
MPKILGIDLGTTNSAMAVIEGGEPKILENEEGVRTTPSMVAISKAGDRVTGLLAKRQAVTNPENTVFSVKRLIGRKFTDPEVERDKKWLSYKIQASANGGVEAKMGDKWLRPEEISAMILQKLKRDAEAKLGEKIDAAVITVPAYFDDSQRAATKAAGEIAGFEVKRILPEPTAAALAYGLNKKKDEKIVVYDFGGGTFDVSVLEVSSDTVEVRAIGGDTHLGGDDLDQILINYLAGEFKKSDGIDLSKDALALQRLKEAAEKAKHELSTTVETEINIPFITADASGPKHFLIKLARAKLENLVRDLIVKSINITKDTVTLASPKGAGFKLSEIDEIILVGGQTRMPAIQEEVKKLFGKEPNRTINPDEVVALGAAAQAGILQGDIKDVLLLDVTPLSLGIETLGGVFTKIIEKNMTIPISKSQVFSTAADNQTSVEVHVLQGEREIAQYNKTLGRFILDGIAPSSRGMPQVEVSFDIDANGILNVKARDKATNKEQSVRIEASTGLSKEDIEKMKQDAEAHKTEDHKRRESVEIKNQADALVYTAEKALKDAGDKVPAETKSEIEEKIAELKGVKDGENTEDIKNKTEELSKSISKIGEALYKNNPQEGPNPTGSAEKEREAEYEDVNKEEKKDDNKS